MGFKGIADKDGKHLGYKMYPTASRLIKCYDTRAYYCEFPADFCAGKHLIFVCIKIIENKYVGDVKAPLLRVIDSKHIPKT